MSEQSLVERLRELSADLSVWQLDDAEQAMHEAADRIDALGSQCAAMMEALRRNQERIEALEAPLSKSEPVAEVIQWRHGPDVVFTAKGAGLPHGTKLFAAPPVVSKDAEDAAPKKGVIKDELGPDGYCVGCTCSHEELDPCRWAEKAAKTAMSGVQEGGKA